MMSYFFPRSCGLRVCGFRTSISCLACLPAKSPIWSDFVFGLRRDAFADRLRPVLGFVRCFRPLQMASCRRACRLEIAPRGRGCSVISFNLSANHLSFNSFRRHDDRMRQPFRSCAGLAERFIRLQAAGPRGRNLLQLRL